MANTLATSPGTVVNDATIGTIAWNNPDNAKVSDNAGATLFIDATISITNYLKATNFGFDIPTGAEIEGILVEVERRDTGSASEYAIKIVKASGTIGTTNKATEGATFPGSYEYKSYGGSSDLWGETWTAEDINNSNFGVVFAVENTTTSFSTNVYVDHIRITVYYTEAVSTITGVQTITGINTLTFGTTGNQNADPV